MASLAESSVQSVPIGVVNVLRQQLLQPEADNNHAHASGADVDDSTDTSKQATIAESVGAYDHAHAIPKTAGKTSPPRLSASKSAPAGTMEAMIGQTPSQEAFGEFTRASSIPAGGWPGGDTQEDPSQVLEDWRRSMAISKTSAATTTPKKPIMKAVTSPDGQTVYELDTVRTDVDGGTAEPHTFVEGETGYMDLGKDFPDPSPGGRSESSHVRELLESEKTQRTNIDGVGPRNMPETPMVAGRKHGRDGELLPPPTTTKKTSPGFSQLFGVAGQKSNLLSGTQMFNQTQAPSSPMLDGPRSDPVMTRPSPNLQHQLTMSSPLAHYSSPVIPREALQSSMPFEPRANYFSVAESQERRAAKFRQELGITERFSEDVWEDDFSHDTQRQIYEQRRLRRQQGELLMNQAQNIRAPSRPGSRPTSSPKAPAPAAVVDLTTPAVEKRGDVVDVESDLDDDHANEDEAILELEAEDENVGGNDDDDKEEGEEDYYDELAQDVCRSQGPDEDLDQDGRSPSAAGDEPEDMEEDQEAVMNESSHPQRGYEHQQQPQGAIASQHTAIADSQPGRQASVPDNDQVGGRRTSSFVPGSQYTGKTSVEQAITSSKGREDERRVPSTNEDRMPSSPPVSTHDAMDAVELMRVNSKHPIAPDTDRSSANAALEVPESDIAGSDGIQQRPASRSANISGESNINQLFSTARSHVSGYSPSKHGSHLDVSPLKGSASQNSKSVSQTPRTRAGVRRFTDIAADADTPKASADDLDIDAITSDLVTAEDQAYFEAVQESPTSERAQKRRKITHNSDASATSSPFKSIPRQSKRLTRFAGEAFPEAQREGSDTVSEAVNHLPADVLQDRPSKANELRAPSPQPDAVPDCTPESVEQREEAGAKAASQLLSRRSSRVPKPSTLRTTKRAKSNLTTMQRRVETPVQAEEADQPNVIDETITETTAVADNAAAIPRDLPITEATPNEEQPKVTSLQQETAPRVLALFKGTYNQFYPATWLGYSADGKKCRVRFEDGNVTTIETKHVRKFDLRVGDVVKVDLPNVPKKTYVVVGLGRLAQTQDDVASGVDASGHVTVHVQAKGPRASGAVMNTTTAKEQGSVEVPASSIYLTHAMWPHVAERSFTPPNATGIDPSRPETPSNGVRTPDGNTPTSRSRRTVIPTTKAIHSRSSHLREEPIVASSPSIGNAVFSNMAFAISYGSNENEKANVTRMIVRNGGMILEHGFEELFALPNLDDCELTTPAKVDNAENAELDTENASLRLKPEYERLSFVALIADKHSRRAKYVQALALGLPTLSGRWIADCLDSSRNASVSTPEAKPLPWSKYLLPAGESSFLNGAIRSRSMSVYPAANAKLASTIQNRDILLGGDGVLIVAPKKGKATWERRKAYAFLTLALGAGAVKRVTDLAEAKAYVAGDESKWRWVYVDGSVSEASKVVFGGQGSKRTRDDKSDERKKVEKKGDAKAMVAVGMEGRVRVVNDEFVVQSLILGALID